MYVRMGRCTFSVKYLGSVKVQESRGMVACKLLLVIIYVCQDGSVHVLSEVLGERGGAGVPRDGGLQVLHQSSYSTLLPSFLLFVP
jgi:hypothetical protein